MFGSVDRPCLVRRHDHSFGDLGLGDVPDHIVDRQGQRSRIGLQDAPEYVVMRGLLIEEVIANRVTGLDRAHDLAEGLRRSMDLGTYPESPALQTGRRVSPGPAASGRSRESRGRHWLRAR